MVIDCESLCEEVGDQLSRGFESHAEVFVATDGSAHQQLAALAVIFPTLDTSVSGGIPSEDQTPFRAETEALSLVIRSALAVWDKRFMVRRLVIVSDCEAAIAVVQGSSSCVPVLAKRLQEALRLLRQHIDTKLMWIPCGNQPLGAKVSAQHVRLGHQCILPYGSRPRSPSIVKQTTSSSGPAEAQY